MQEGMGDGEEANLPGTSTMASLTLCVCPPTQCTVYLFKIDFHILEQVQNYNKTEQKVQ